MIDETLIIRMPKAQKDSLLLLARRRDQTPGQIMRDLLAAELSRKPAKTPNRADERLVARLQRLLAPVMAEAQDWPGLAEALYREGFEIRPAGGGLTLHELPSGRRLCKSSELGFAYSRLVRRFGAPMPGHPHQMRHILGRGRALSLGAPTRDDADFDLIEPFDPT